MVVVQEKRVKARNKTHQRVKGALFDLVVVTVKCITRSESYHQIALMYTAHAIFYLTIIVLILLCLTLSERF